MRATEHQIRDRHSLPVTGRLAAAVLLGIALSVVIALLLAGESIVPGVLAFLGLCTGLLAVAAPYAALVVTIAQFAFIPCEDTLLGFHVPNVLQFIGPVLLLSVLVRALKNHSHQRLTPRIEDFLIPGLAIWGLLGLFLTGTGGRWKWYTNRMLLPIALYFVVRLIWLNREQLVRLLAVTLAAVATQGVLMFRESWAGGSSLYSVQEGLVQGVKSATGPFPYHWNAATFLAAWPTFFVYMMANARGGLRKLLWGLGLLAVLGANARTMERAGIAASILAIAVCLLSSRLRRTAGITLAMLAVLCIPWSMGSAGGALLDRFNQTDQSRLAYRDSAIRLLGSADWNPVYGVGWFNFKSVAGRHGTSEEIVAWGSRRASAAEIARGSALHNVWLAIPVELGLVGTVLAAGIIVVFVVRVIAILRRARDAPVDTGLLVAVAGSLLALSAVGYYHNVYTYSASMSVMWFLYSVVVAQPHAFDMDSPAEHADRQDGHVAT